jgi:hypothetical protein
MNSMEKIAYKSDLDVGHILTPIYVENNTSHTKSVGILHKEYYKEHRQNKILQNWLKKLMCHKKIPT